MPPRCQDPGLVAILLRMCVSIFGAFGVSTQLGSLLIYSLYPTTVKRTNPNPNPDANPNRSCSEPSPMKDKSADNFSVFS